MLERGSSFCFDYHKMNILALEIILGVLVFLFFFFLVCFLTGVCVQCNETGLPSTNEV